MFLDIVFEFKLFTICNELLILGQSVGCMTNRSFEMNISRYLIEIAILSQLNRIFNPNKNVINL